MTRTHVSERVASHGPRRFCAGVFPDSRRRRRTRYLSRRHVLQRCGDPRPCVERQPAVPQQPDPQVGCHSGRLQARAAAHQQPGLRGGGQLGAVRRVPFGVPAGSAVTCSLRSIWFLTGTLPRARPTATATGQGQYLRCGAQEDLCVAACTAPHRLERDSQPARRPSDLSSPTRDAAAKQGLGGVVGQVAAGAVLAVVAVAAVTIGRGNVRFPCACRAAPCRLTPDRRIFTSGVRGRDTLLLPGPVQPELDLGVAARRHVPGAPEHVAAHFLVDLFGGV